MSARQHRQLTSHTGEQLSSKVLDLTVGERDEIVALQEIEYALAEEVHDNADVAPVVKAIAKVDTTIPVLRVVGLKSRQHA